MYSEQRIKTVLGKLADNWNDKFWLFAADGELHLMQKNPDGTRMVTPYGGMAQGAVRYSAKIESDGGDW